MEKFFNTFYPESHSRANGKKREKVEGVKCCNARLDTVIVFRIFLKSFFNIHLNSYCTDVIIILCGLSKERMKLQPG
jgi:hypothetical protein